MNNKKVLILLKSNITHDFRVLKESTTLSMENYNINIIFNIKKNEKYSCNFQFILKPISYPINNSLTIQKVFNHLYTSIKFIIEGIKVKPYIVHCNDLNTLFEGFIISIVTKSKLVYDSHELWYERIPLYKKNGKRNYFRVVLKSIEKFLEKLLCLRVNGIITVCDSIVEHIRNNLILKKRIVVVANACYWNKITNFGENVYDKFYTETKGKKILLFRGNVDLSNFDFQVFKSLKYLNNIIIVVLGYIREEDKRDLINELKKDNIDNKVLFVDKVSVEELPKYILSADIGLIIKRNTCLSIYYSLPNKLFEYISYGIPIISNNLLEVGKILKTYQIGQTYIEGDYLSFIKAVKNLTNEKTYLTYKDNLNKCFKGVFNWEIESKKLLEIYNSL